MVGQHSPGQGHGGEETEALPLQAGHCLSPTRQGRGWSGEPHTGQKVGMQLYCPLVLSLAGWQAGQGRKTNSGSALQQGEGESKRKDGSAPLAPNSLQTAGSRRRSGPGWSGPASSLPSFPGGPQNYPPGTALYFLKPDQRWDPAGSSSKISALWSLGVSLGKPGAGGRGAVPGPACRLRGETRVRSGAGGWGPVKKGR